MRLDQQVVITGACCCWPRRGRAHFPARAPRPLLLHDADAVNTASNNNTANATTAAAAAAAAAAMLVLVLLLVLLVLVLLVLLVLVLMLRQWICCDCAGALRGRRRCKE